MCHKFNCKNLLVSWYLSSETHIELNLVTAVPKKYLKRESFCSFLCVFYTDVYYYVNTFIPSDVCKNAFTKIIH